MELFCFVQFKNKARLCVSGWFELVCRLNIIRLNWTRLRQNYTSLGLEFVLFWIDFLRLHWKCDQVHNPSSVFAVSWTYMNVLLFLLFFLWGGCTSRFNIIGPFRNVLSIAILHYFIDETNCEISLWPYFSPWKRLGPHSAAAQSAALATQPYSESLSTAI